MNQLSKLNKDATEIFMKLINGLSEPGAYATFDEHTYLPKRRGGIMSVHVECIGKARYSVAHYYEQNGDLLSDPQMTFWVNHGFVYPCSYTLHGFLQRFEISVIFDDNEMPKTADRKMQEHHTVFTNTWMLNIKEQQEL